MDNASTPGDHLIGNMFLSVFLQAKFQFSIPKYTGYLIGLLCDITMYYVTPQENEVKEHTIQMIFDELHEKRRDFRRELK